MGPESLEARTVMAIAVAAPLPDLWFAPNATAAPIDTAAGFSVSGVALQGTVVKLATQAGSDASVRNLFVELYDQAGPGRSAAPISTANFLTYVTSASYSSTFFHRATDFAGDNGPAKFLQGGGFTNISGASIGTVVTGAPITLEWAADRPNAAGTIAYARTSDPNSATSGFFFNVAANPGFDSTGNQYATFGRVVGDGQTILNAYAALTRVNAGVTFATLPVSSVAGLSNDNIRDRLLMLRSATVVASPATAFGLAASSSDPAIASVLVDAAGKLYLASGAKHGTATITVTATDLSGASVQDAFTVSVGIPGIGVADGVTALASAQARAVGLGAAAVGATAAAKTFTVTNSGDAPLSIGGVTLPAGVKVVQALPASIPVGGSANLIVALDTAAVKSVSGSIAIATNAAGSPFSIPVAGTVYGKPAAPTGVVTAWANGVKVVITWTPAVDNGSPLSGSTVYAMKVGTPSWTKVANVAGSATSVEVTGLDITAAWAFKINSTNAAGIGPLSAGAKWLYAPLAPGLIVAASTAPGTATISWQNALQPWDPIGKIFRPLTGYVLFYREVGTAAWTRSGDLPVVTSTDVTGLVVGKTYQFALRAKSDSGGSLISRPSNSLKV